MPGATWLQLDERLRPACHRGKYVGFTNAYGRMRWDEPAPTITSGCVTPAKGRFGHPDRRRTTISVREAACLQTFPKTYEFASDFIDDVSEMIGNAVPPEFARILGQAVGRAIIAHRSATRT
jgi:DNA (cytosine-5)-methyltransferase 1